MRQHGTTSCFVPEITAEGCLLQTKEIIEFKEFDETGELSEGLTRRHPLAEKLQNKTLLYE